MIVQYYKALNMKKIFENVNRLTSDKDYRILSAHLENLIQEAIQGGHLATQDPGNEYRREIGRLSRLGGIYEAEYMTFDFGEPPLVKSVKKEIALRGLRQREAAKLLGVPEPSFSRFLNGKRKLSFEFAQRLYKNLNIDPKAILSS
jgi:antitoxin component HigA of HigAB toxin-antitoxin module